jgi:hypothetical protein
MMRIVTPLVAFGSMLAALLAGDSVPVTALVTVAAVLAAILVSTHPAIGSGFLFSVLAAAAVAAAVMFGFDLGTRSFSAAAAATSIYIAYRALSAPTHDTGATDLELDEPASSKPSAFAATAGFLAGGVALLAAALVGSQLGVTTEDPATAQVSASVSVTDGEMLVRVDAAGLAGDRWVFTAGPLRQEGRLDSSGTLTRTFTAPCSPRVSFTVGDAVLDTPGCEPGGR